MQISEVFGFGITNQSEEAWASRRARRCPFRNAPCTKSSKADPIGICSLSDGGEAATLCPVRFVERDIIFKDAARLAFGENIRIGVFPEVRILEIKKSRTKRKNTKIGKVDYLIGKIEGDQVIDFAAVEVQAVYFSGKEIRSSLKYYMENGSFELHNSDRRPDFRSSAQKRLVPQLQLKIPVFRRWGKKVFIVVDSLFFKSLPTFEETTHANSEVTWLSYPIEPSGKDYTVGEANISYSEWDEVRNALREGTPPDPNEIVAELQEKLHRPQNPARTLDI